MNGSDRTYEPTVPRAGQRIRARSSLGEHHMPLTVGNGSVGLHEGSEPTPKPNTWRGSRAEPSRAEKPKQTDLPLLHSTSWTSLFIVYLTTKRPLPSPNTWGPIHTTNVCWHHKSHRMEPIPVSYCTTEITFI